jgi:hypothetical protein
MVYCIIFDDVKYRMLGLWIRVFSYSNTLPLDTVLPFVIEDGNMAAYSKIKLIQIKEDYSINENITELGHIIYGGYSEFSWKEK